jgi:hypothetical protein
MEEKVVRASFDRIEGGFAVIYADCYDDYDKDRQPLYNKIDVPLKLVKDAKPGMRLKLYIENSVVTRIEIDKEATDRAKDRIRKKYEKLNHSF